MGTDGTIPWTARHRARPWRFLGHGKRRGALAHRSAVRACGPDSSATFPLVGDQTYGSVAMAHSRLGASVATSTERAGVRHHRPACWTILFFWTRRRVALLCLAAQVWRSQPEVHAPCGGDYRPRLLTVRGHCAAIQQAMGPQVQRRPPVSRTHGGEGRQHAQPLA